MKKQKLRLLQDIAIIGALTWATIWLLQIGLIEEIIRAAGRFELLAVLLAGFFFTSAFTTPIAIAVLGVLALSVPLPVLALLGALGAMCGDYIIFRFIKDRVAEDLQFLFSAAKRHRFSLIFQTGLFRYLWPFIGALVIASPFPDEIGVTMLGLSKTNNKVFLAIAFVFNALGIYLIGYLARALVL